LHEKILTFPDEAIVYPAHDYKGWTMSTIGEEKRHNPRLQPVTKEAFIELMNSLDLPNPKMMDVAVPANRACGLGND
jgi:glyoxylase-like metal-dependent hydrolase (beta-lactamase superfamily II)